MKHTILYLLICSLFTLGGCKSEINNKQPISVMSFNIRLDAASDGENNWKFRKKHIFQMLQYYQPDLIGMQEVCHNQMEDLKQALQTYDAIGVGRDNGKENGEYCPIFFNTNKFAMLDSGHFSLSEQPQVFGTKGWDASYNRIATWVILQEKSDKTQFIYLNTHLDNDGIMARKEGIKLILNKIKKLAPLLPVVISGDFNCEPNEEPIQILKENGMQNAQTEANVSYGPLCSFHDFGRLPFNQQVLLDYIFTSQEWSIERYRVIEDKPEKVYLSDHYPLLVNLSIK